MKNHLFRKGLVISVIFLFFGIAVQPITSVNITQIEQIRSDDKINDTYGEDDCNCNEVNAQDLERVNKLLDNIEVKIKNILSKYNYIPDVKSKFNEILDILDTYDSDSIICDFLHLVDLKLAKIVEYYYNKTLDAYAHGHQILAQFYAYTWLFFVAQLVLIGTIAGYLYCDWIPHPPN